MQGRKLALIPLLVALLLSGAACGASGDGEPTATPTTGPAGTAVPTAEPRAGIEVLSQELDCVDAGGSGYCECHLRGMVKNTSDRSVLTAVVQAEFLDDEGNVITIGSDHVGSLQPGETAYYDIWYWQQGCPADCEVWAEWF